MNALPNWIEHPPTELDEKTALLKSNKRFLRSPGPKGRKLRQILREVENEVGIIEQRAQQADPLAFFKPSFEQALLLNAWVFGIQFIGVYCANRIGKTTAMIINILLWILPNNPKWLIFEPYIDHLGRHVQVLPRPDIKYLGIIKKIVTSPDYLSSPTSPKPNPRRSLHHKDNREYLQLLQTRLPRAFKSNYPSAPWDKSGEIWFGGPNQEHHKKILLPLWKRYIPKKYLERFVMSTREITLKIHAPSGNLTVWELLGKSYEAEDTTWSSGAVDAIMLTEGVTPAILKEVKVRFKVPGIGSHDFTPYEPANQGAASALAQKMFKGKEKMPLYSYFWTEFSVYKAPEHILPEEKRLGLIEAFEGTDEGKARLDGKFFANSMLVLDNLGKHNLLNMTVEEMFATFPEGRIYRGLDPGFDHPTACAWGLLLPGNSWIIYRILSQRGLSIPERCKRIIEMSNNVQALQRYGRQENQFYNLETHPNIKSEIANATIMDFKAFKTDETTGMAFSLHYLLGGLNVIESVHLGPKERAQLLNGDLEMNQYRGHILSHEPPAPRVYFLRRGLGVLDFFNKMEEFYWARKKSGEDKGAAKDEIPDHNDDELDAVCNLTCSPFRWTKHRPSARLVGDSEPELEMIRASQQLNQMRPDTTNPNLASIARSNPRTVKSAREIKVFGDAAEVW